MTVRTINIPDAMNAFLESQIQAGHFVDADAFFQAMIARAQRKSEFEDTLEKALDEIERGEYSLWRDREFQNLGAAILQRRANVAPAALGM